MQVNIQVAVDDRRFDVKDILDKATYGWVAPPTKPTIIVEDRANPRSAYIGKKAKYVTNGVFFIKKDWDYDRTKHSDYYETRLWIFPCIIISESMILLQGLFDQARETFDRYTQPSANTPWSTSTHGTSTTYKYAGIEKGTVDDRITHYALDCIVHLLEQFVDVKVA